MSKKLTKEELENVSFEISHESDYFKDYDETRRLEKWQIGHRRFP
jgi:hypothetical protein